MNPSPNFVPNHATNYIPIQEQPPPPSSTTKQYQITMFNPDNLNANRLEVLRGAAWGRGQIPKLPDSFIELLVQRVDRGRFRCDIGSSSNGPQLQRPQTLPSEMSQASNGNPILGTGQATIVLGPTQEAYLGLVVSLDMGLENLNTWVHLSLGLGPPLPISTCLDPYPILCLQDEEWWDSTAGNPGTTKATRKRFKIEFGKLGRNIRQRLLSGFCLKEGNSNILVDYFDNALLHFEQCYGDIYLAYPKQLP